MKTPLTLNKSNWTGEEITVMVDRETGEFDLYDYNFKLLSSADEEGNIRFKVVSPSWDHTVCSGYKLVGDKEATFSSAGISREDADPIIAAIQVLCNTI